MTGSEGSPASTPTWVIEGYFGANNNPSSDQHPSTRLATKPDARNSSYPSSNGSYGVTSHQGPIVLHRSSNRKEIETPSTALSTPGPGWRVVHEGTLDLEASTFKLFLMSSLNRLLVLYHTGRFAEALPIIENAYQRANEFGESSMFTRIALWRAIIHDRMNQVSEIPKMLGYALALDICSSINSSDPDRVRLLKIVIKYAMRIDIWSGHAKRDGTAACLIPAHPASVYLEILEADLERKSSSPISGINTVDLKKWTSQQRSDLPSQPSSGERTGSVSDVVFMIPPSASETSQQILRLVAEEKASKDISIKFQPEVVDSKTSSPVHDDESLFQQLMAEMEVQDDTQHGYPNSIQNSATLNSSNAKGRLAQQDQPESPPYRGQITPFLDELKQCKSHRRRMYPAPGNKTVPSLKHLEEPTAEVRTELASNRKERFVEASTQTSLSGSSVWSFQHQSTLPGGSEVNQNPSPKDRTVSLAVSEDAVLTDTPGGTKLDGLIERRKSIEVRRRSLPSIETNIQELGSRYSLGHSVSPGSNRRSSIDHSLPTVQSPLRRSSLAADLDDDKDESSQLETA